MKFVVATYGTEGDTRPLGALCRALLDAGHEARLLGDAAALDSASALGVPTTALAGDIKTILQPSRRTSPSATARDLARVSNANTGSWLQAILGAGRGSDAIIVSALASFVGLSAAECLGIPAIGAGFIPITPTAAFPSPLLPPALVPRWLNKTSHEFVNSAVWSLLRKKTNVARAASCRLPPRRRVWTDHPILWGVSPALVPRPDDYPANVHICGQWIRPARDWSPPARLSEFLAAGEPPVYLGFGSMAGLMQPALLRELIAGIGGRRTLYFPGWSQVTATDLPDNFLVVRDTPHDWLLPRAALVIHHGGAGTTHSAARAGVPSVVLPFAGDQPFWADRLHKAGVAPPALNVRRLRAAELAASIAFAEGAEVRARAVALGVEMARENGLANAISALETLMMGRAKNQPRGTGT